MDKIPKEVLNNIFIYLPIVQKQECMLVCQQWNVVIQNQSLLHTVTLPFRPKLLEKFILMMQQKPHLSHQVEELIIPGCLDKRNFLYLFPKLRIIRNSASYGNISPTNINSGLRDDPLSIPLSIQLQYIEDRLQYPITDALLKSGYCSRITRLSLHGGYDKTSTNIFSHLTEAPMIKYLKLTSVNLSITDCDLIDSSLYLMQEFELHGCSIIVSPIPDNVFPNNILTTLIIKTARFINNGSTSSSEHLNSDFESDFNRYIVLKYRKVQRFVYTMGFISYRSGDVKNLIQNRYIFILRSFGKHLKSLSLTSADRIDPSIFEVLDSCGCQLTDLDLYMVEDLNLDNLGRSVQSIYIKNLGLHNVDIISFEWLNKMKQLKVFKIDYKKHIDDSRQDLGHTTELYELFLECSQTIISVTICSYIEFHLHAIRKNVYIKELDLSGHRLPLGSDICIGRVFPNLRNLRLELNYLQGSTISFPDHNFTILDLRIHHTRFAIKTLNDNKTRFFSIELYKSRADYSVFDNGMLPVQEEVFNNKPFASIVCGSVKNLILEDVPAYF